MVCPLKVPGGLFGKRGIFGKISQRTGDVAAAMIAGHPVAAALHKVIRVVLSVLFRVFRPFPRIPGLRGGIAMLQPPAAIPKGAGKLLKIVLIPFRRAEKKRDAVVTAGDHKGDCLAF